MSRKQISPERKGVFYVGMGLSVLGLISFGSVFVSIASHFGEFNLPQSFGKSLAIRGFGGFALIILGQGLCVIGRMGLAGSGAILDPEQARKDIEPWARMGGGVIKDALDEADMNLGSKTAELPFDEQLRRLHKLREDGIVSEAEYQAKKKRILENC